MAPGTTAAVDPTVALAVPDRLRGAPWPEAEALARDLQRRAAEGA